MPSKFLQKEADLKFGIRQFEAILMKDTLKCICFTFDYNDKFVTVWWLASSSCLRNHWRGICRAPGLSRLGVWKVPQQSPMPSKFLLKLILNSSTVGLGRYQLQVLNYSQLVERNGQDAVLFSAVYFHASLRYNLIRQFEANFNEGAF